MTTQDLFKVPSLNAKTLSFSALLLAVDVVLYKFAIGPSFFQVSFGFLSMALMGYLFGPVWAGVLETLSNTLNFTLFGSGNFNPLFLIAAFLGGFINGYLYYKRDVSWVRILIAQILIMGILSLCLNSYFISLVYQADFVSVFLGRAVRNLLLIPIQTILIYLFFKALISRKVFNQYLDGK